MKSSMNPLSGVAGERERQSDRQKDIDRNSDRDREKERQRERDREGKRKREEGGGERKMLSNWSQ